MIITFVVGTVDDPPRKFAIDVSRIVAVAEWHDGKAQLILDSREYPIIMLNETFTNVMVAIKEFQR